MDLSVARWLETVAYQQQKEVINREINDNRPFGRSFAKPRMDAPQEYSRTDYSVFKKSKVELEETITAKQNHKRELQEYYGSDWKNHLNIPSRQLSESIKLTF
jgi:hypothetical protein